MNCQRFSLDPLIIDRSHLHSALQSFVHLVLINRTLGAVRTRDIWCSDLDLQNTVIDDSKLLLFVDSKIKELMKPLDDSGCGGISVSFYERRLGKTLLLTNKEDKFVWEQWCLPIQLRDCPKNARSGALRAGISFNPMSKSDVELVLRELLMNVLRLVNEYQRHLPPVPECGESSTYPFENDASIV